MYVLALDFIYLRRPLVLKESSFSILYSDYQAHRNDDLGIVTSPRDYSNKSKRINDVFLTFMVATYKHVYTFWMCIHQIKL
jgi:hypothetical protein